MKLHARIQKVFPEENVLLFFLLMRGEGRIPNNTIRGQSLAARETPLNDVVSLACQ